MAFFNTITIPVLALGFGDIGDMLTGALDSIGSSIINAIATAVGKGLYYLVDVGLLKIVNMFYNLFSVFAGLQKVSYTYRNEETKDYLVNIFLKNSTINNIYWGMAIIGIALVFAFALIAVIRKIFDLYDKQQRSLGAILTGVFKSILIILLLTFGVTGVMSMSNILLQTISDAFNNANIYAAPSEITFTNAQYATMARVLNTIGNYSLNPSYNSRYNINSCFNEIRGDLYSLSEEGVFDVSYPVTDAEGKPVNNWQNCLQRIVNSADVTRDLSMDVYNANVSTSLTAVMEIIRSDASLLPLESYENAVKPMSNVPIDRILFLLGTDNAALNEAYNANPSTADPVRGPFYAGEKDQYKLSDVMQYFDIRVGGMAYVTVAILAWLTLKALWRCIFQLAARLFSLVGLYLVAPPFIATMPLDDGEKFKQWMTAFIVQSFGVIGNVIPMRLILLFAPLILDSGLVLFPDNPALNFLGKAILVIGGFEAVDRFNGLITGILTNNAGMEALRAGSTNDKADSLFSAGLKGAASAGGAALSATGTGLKAAGKVAGGVAGVVSDVTGLTTLGNKIGSGLSSVAGGASNFYNSMKEHGGIVGASYNALSGKGSSADLPASNGSMAGEKDTGK